MTASTEDWPSPTAAVELSWRLQTFDAEVVHADDEHMICAPPSRPGVLLPRAPVDATARWTRRDGIHTRTCHMVRTEDGHVHLKATGPMESTQRRAYVRAPVAVKISMEDAAGSVTGWTGDLSEGGARVFLDEPAPTKATTVRVQMVLGDATLSVRARVIRIRDDDEQSEIGLTFADMPAGDADAIRRQVFTAQVEARRNGHVL